jgi:hypothetical protein
VALAFFCHDVDDDRLADSPSLREDVAEQLDVVAVYGTRVLETQVGEQAFLEEHRLDGALETENHGVQPRSEPGHTEYDAVYEHAQPLVPCRRGQPGEVARQRAYVARYGHLVVVEYDDERQAQLPGMAHRLPGHASRQSAVANHRDYGAGMA